MSCYQDRRARETLTGHGSSSALQSARPIVLVDSARAFLKSLEVREEQSITHRAKIRMSSTTGPDAFKYVSVQLSKEVTRVCEAL